MLKIDGQQLAVAFCGFDHRVSFGNLHGDGLFHQYVAACIERIDSEGCMKGMGRDHHGYVGLQLGQHLLVIGVEGDVVLGQFLGCRGVNIAETD